MAARRQLTLEHEGRRVVGAVGPEGRQAGKLGVDGEVLPRGRAAGGRGGGAQSRARSGAAVCLLAGLLPQFGITGPANLWLGPATTMLLWCQGAGGVVRLVEKEAQRTRSNTRARARLALT